MTVTSSLAIIYCYHRLCGNSRLATTTLSLKDDTYLSLLGATCTLNYAKLPYIYYERIMNPMTIIPVVWLKTTPQTTPSPYDHALMVTKPFLPPDSFSPLFLTLET